MTTVSGMVYDANGDPVGRTVRAYRRDTGGLLGSAVYAGDIPSSGLSSYYTMDNITGGTTLVDEQGVANGTISGATVVAGVSGNALSFDGVNDQVNLGAAAGASLTGSISVCAWVKNNDSGNAVFVSKYEAIPCFFELGKSVTAYYFRTGTTAGVNVELFDTATADSYGSNFVFIIGEYDSANSKLRIYVNNAMKAEMTTTRSAPRTSDVAYLGRRAFSGAEEFGAAVIDNVRFFNRVLTAQEKTALFQEWLGLATGEYAIDCGTYTGEVQVIALDDSGGTLENDRILRAYPV